MLVAGVLLDEKKIWPVKLAAVDASTSYPSDVAAPGPVPCAVQFKVTLVLKTWYTWLFVTVSAKVDVDGCVWSAHWGAGQVVRYTPAGKIDRTVDVPTSNPSCVCFGGPKLDTLCVTTARADLEPTELAAQPHAGDVFLYNAGTQGLPEPEYRL